MWNQDWAAQAACRASQPDKLFVRGAEQNKAKQVCGACPVRTECLAEALDNQIEWGVWGGMTERERRAKVINAEGEFQAAEKLVQAARMIAEQPIALQLRYLQTMKEISSEHNTTTFLPIPMDLFAPFFKESEPAK